MKRIGYGETAVATDGRVADLVLEYATLLAGSGAADTVTVPGRVGDGPVEPVSLLIGPASQLTAWEVDGDLGVDVTAARDDLERRIRAMVQVIPAEEGRPDTAAVEALEGPTGA